MGKLRALWKRLQGIFDAKHGNDFSGELNSHLEMHIEDNLRSGMSSEQARRDALIKLGGAEQAKQAYRERRRLPLLDSLVQDVHFGLRILRRGPGFTAVAVLTSAVGIGANTAIFSFVDALFLKPLPVSHPENLIRIYAEGPSGHYGDLDGRSIADVKSSPLFKVST
jgi:putative ABC transport system permease protein